MLLLLIRCHVMEVESFEDEEVAKLLNDWFVSIKVNLKVLCFTLHIASYL